MPPPSRPPTWQARQPAAPVVPRLPVVATMGTAPTSTAPPLSINLGLAPATLPTRILAPLKRAAPSPPGDPQGRSPRRPNPYDLRADRLGTLVKSLTDDLERAGSWETFVEEFRGRSYLAPELDTLDHPAAPLLRHWRTKGSPQTLHPILGPRPHETPTSNGVATAPPWSTPTSSAKR